ncbi:MAG: RNA methyltransferase [Actinomycetota bacterium]|nr:RNA methyltransferase [Actinomycetota bacterium]
MITSFRNPHVQAARKLVKRGVRDAKRRFLVEGAIGVGEAISRGARLASLIVDPSKEGFEEQVRAARQRKVPVLEVSRAIMGAISGATTPPGIMAVAEFLDLPPEILLDRPIGLVVVLAGVRDPGNAGTIIRSACAVGVDAVFVGAETVDLYNPKLIRATAGAVFHVPIARNVAVPWLLTELGKRQIKRLAADPKGETVYDQVDMSGRVAFILGNEAWGVTPEIAGAVDARVAIPMKGGQESLNVGMAASVLLFEAARQRRTVA